MFRLVKTQVIMQTQRFVRSLSGDPHCLRAKYLIAPPARKKVEPLAERKEFDGEPRFGVTRLQGITAISSAPLTVDNPDRSPKDLPTEPKPRQAYNLLSLRRAVNPTRLKFVQERHQQLQAEVELRQQNAKPFLTRQALHSGRLDKIK